MAPLRLVRHWLIGDRPPLDENERRLVLRVTALIAVPLATITALILLLALLALGGDLRGRTERNKEAIEQAKDAAKQAQKTAARLELVRRNADNALAWRVYDECVENENQDATNTALFRKVRALVLQGPPTPARDALIDGLDDAIGSREPFGEMDCVLPPRPRPGNEP